jgi:hypothetical protein
MRKGWLVFFLFSMTCGIHAWAGRTLSFEERTKVQEAIERASHDHPVPGATGGTGGKGLGGQAPEGSTISGKIRSSFPAIAPKLVQTSELEPQILQVDGAAVAGYAPQRKADGPFAPEASLAPEERQALDALAERSGRFHSTGGILSPFFPERFGDPFSISCGGQRRGCAGCRCGLRRDAPWEALGAPLLSP